MCRNKRFVATKVILMAAPASDSHLGVLHCSEKYVFFAFDFQASQAVESERESVMMNLYRFSNVNASSIRTIMVANIPVISEETHTFQPAPGCEHALCTDCGLYLASVDSDSEQGQGEVMSNSTCEEFRRGNSLVELEGVCIEREGGEELEEGAVSIREDWNSMDWDEVESSLALESVADGMDSNKRSSLALADGSSASRDVSGSLNHSPAKSACYRSLDEPGSVACAVDYLPSTSAGLSSLRCCCQRRSSASSPRVQSAGGSRDTSRVMKHRHDDRASFSKPELSVPPSADVLSGPPSSLPPQRVGPQGDASHKQVTDIPRTNSSTQLTGTCTQMEKLLIFTMGEETYTPHLIGIKRIRLQDIRGEEEGAEVVGWPEGEGNLLPNVDQNFQGMDRPPSTVDHTINMHGHIVGMALSPDQR